MGCALHWVMDSANAPSVAEIKDMEKELAAFLRHNRTSFMGTCNMFVSAIEVDAKIKLTTVFSFAYNGLDGMRANKDKQRVMEVVGGMLKRRGVTFTTAGGAALQVGRKLD